MGAGRNSRIVLLIVENWDLRWFQFYNQEGHPLDASLSQRSAVFDDPNLVSCAGLAPTMALAGRCGLADLVAANLTLKAAGGVNAAVKVPALVAGMVAGADSIDLCRHRDYADKVGLAAAETHVRARFRC